MMNASRLILASAAMAPLLLAFSLHAVEPAAGAEPAGDSLAEAFKGGKVSLNMRARYEGVDQTGVENADALTLRTRLGFTTADFHSFSASFEVSNTSAADKDSYNQAGANPGGAGKAVIADPVGTDVTQAWLAYTADAGNLKLGRARLVLDNARFIGDVGWRQKYQTFDAIVAQGGFSNHFNLTYAYLNRIHRVFGDDHPQGKWDSDSHVFNVSYDGLGDIKIVGYAYLLDFDNAAANSCNTYGLSAAGTHKLDFGSIAYRLEYARQTDAGNNPDDYSNAYYLGELGLTNSGVTGAVGYEVLGTGDGVGFKTPLATLHAFNGWADVFLNTPADGLRDLYGKASVNLPRDVTLLGFYHHFDSDTGDNLGSEWDIQAVWKINKQFSALIKYADFSAANASGLADVSKIWVQAEFIF